MITEDQLKARVGKIGSSDAPNILGLCPYGNKSPQQQLRDAYFSIIGQRRKEPTPVMMEGTFLEEGILSWAEWKIRRARDEMDRHQGQAADAPLDFMAANFDGVFYTDGSRGPIEIVVEAKYVRDERMQATWGRSGTVVRNAECGIVPEHVLVQVHHQMIVAGPQCRLAYVAALRGGKGCGLYPVERCDALCEIIVQREREFYNKYIVPRIAPEAPETETTTEAEAA